MGRGGPALPKKPASVCEPPGVRGAPASSHVFAACSRGCHSPKVDGAAEHVCSCWPCGAGGSAGPATAPAGPGRRVTPATGHGGVAPLGRASPPPTLDLTAASPELRLVPWGGKRKTKHGSARLPEPKGISPPLGAEVRRGGRAAGPASRQAAWLCGVGNRPLVKTPAEGGAQGPPPSPGATPEPTPQRRGSACPVRVSSQNRERSAASPDARNKHP